MMFRSYFEQYTWWGKVLGAALGFLIAGPSGAIFGVFIGNLFDRGLNEHLTKTSNAYRLEKNLDIKKAYQRAVFLVMGHLCKADGYVSKASIQFAKQTMNDLRLNRTERLAAQQFFTQGKARDFNINEPVHLLKNLSIKNAKLLQAFIQIQYRVAQIDPLTPQKIAILNQILEALDMAPLHRQPHAHGHAYQENHYYRQQQNNTHTTTHTNVSLDEAYKRLNLPTHASKQEVKRAYRQKISLYHPDKQIAKGASSEAIKKANEQTQAVRKAYELICTKHGW